VKSGVASMERTVGEFVVYRNGCIYRIEDIRKEDLWGDGDRLYYVLRPVYEERSLTYVPADSGDAERLMRSVLTREQIDSAIAAAETGELEWPHDAKQRAALYDRLIAEGNASATLMIYRQISRHRQEVEGKKKKLYASDARILERAEKAVTEEFAFVLGIKKDQVLPYIKSRL